VGTEHVTATPQIQTEFLTTNESQTVSKHFLLFHIDAHDYKITGILKQLKFWRSLRHVSIHVGTIIREPVLCLAKRLQLWFYPRRLWRGQCHGSMPNCCVGEWYTVEEGSLMMVPAWIETCRSDRRNFNCFNIPGFYNCEHHCGIIISALIAFLVLVSW
jgi:hypothetical protein